MIVLLPPAMLLEDIDLVEQARSVVSEDVYLRRGEKVVE